MVIGYDGTESKIGSFAGRINGTIEGCKSYATVYGVDSVGGIVGNQDNSVTTFKVTDCEFHGIVEASGEEAGGIIGSGYIGGWADNAMRPNISHCTVTGSISGSNKVGGIQGGDSVVIQTYARTPNEMTGNTFSGHLYSEDEAIQAAIKAGCKDFQEKSRSISRGQLDLVVELRVKDGIALTDAISKIQGVGSVSLMKHDGEVTY